MAVNGRRALETTLSDERLWLHCSDWWWFLLWLGISQLLQFCLPIVLHIAYSVYKQLTQHRFLYIHAYIGLCTVQTMLLFSNNLTGHFHAWISEGVFRNLLCMWNAQFICSLVRRFLPLGVASCCASIQLVPYGAVNRNKVSVRQLPLCFPSHLLHVSAPTVHLQVRYTTRYS
jgi:hypothetical protein